MRILDGKFHLEGEQLIKTSNGEPVPENEPLFILRGRDRLALATIERYYELCGADGRTDFQLDAVLVAHSKFKDFIKAHPERMKQPGITKGQ